MLWWSTAAKKGGKWYRGLVKAAGCFMAWWHRDESKSSWLRHAAGVTKRATRERGEGEQPC